MGYDDSGKTGPMEFWHGGGDNDTGEVVDPHSDPNPEVPLILYTEPEPDPRPDGFLDPGIFPEGDH
jgi:hypothetical protein